VDRLLELAGVSQLFPVPEDWRRQKPPWSWLRGVSVSSGYLARCRAVGNRLFPPGRGGPGNWDDSKTACSFYPSGK
jgi:hypothetical protein